MSSFNSTNNKGINGNDERNLNANNDKNNNEMNNQREQHGHATEIITAATSTAEEEAVTIQEITEHSLLEEDGSGQACETRQNDNGNSELLYNDELRINNAGTTGDDERQENNAQHEYHIEEHNFDDLVDSEPDYDYLAEESSFDLSSEEPDYYDALGLDCENDVENDQCNERGNDYNDVSQTPMFNAVENDEYYHHGVVEEEEDLGEEYILGTLMVRVLQARNLKSNHQTHGGGIAGLLFDHRRNRHRSAMSPASGGNITPSSNPHRQLYATLSFRTQTQCTTYASDPTHGPSSNGDYYWSRGDQSYFDVTCSSESIRLARMQQRPLKTKQNQPLPTKENDSCSKPMTQQQHQCRQRFLPPILNLSVYSRKGGPGSLNKQKVQKKNSKNHDDESENDDFLVGKCSINVLRILTGKNSYFDEWCTIHDDKNIAINRHQEAGSVRVVIEYEPTDPPPRPGDLCVFANAYPLAKEVYPIPSFSIQRTVHPLHSTSMSSFAASSLTTLSSASSCSTMKNPSVTAQPKKFRVEEVVGDHIVLSYQTPNEGWLCTFEVHRYLILCTHRHQAAVEKCREHVLDFCDNVSQSPMVETISKTVEILPDEGLVYIGAEAVGGGVSLLGHWWEIGVEGVVEDVVDGMNLDGRYSHLSDEESDNDNSEGVLESEHGGLESHSTTSQLDSTSKTSSRIANDNKKALPGMPCCPITCLPMVDPVVAADGHTYERIAIARWFQTSNQSPLTGSVLAHLDLVPNYLLLSSLGDNSDAVDNVQF